MCVIVNSQRSTAAAAAIVYSVIAINDRHNSSSTESSHASLGLPSRQAPHSMCRSTASPAALLPRTLAAAVLLLSPKGCIGPDSGLPSSVCAAVAAVVAAALRGVHR
eukprot:13680-Heterococcus_DN1.PRE.4